MKRRLFVVLWLVTVLTCIGCAYTDYPIITDSRGDYSGIIRTAHQAYIRPELEVAVVFPDGSDELFSMVLQNQYGDQTIYTYNNFDPTASVLFLDQTYCDWRYDGCAVVEAWNPRQNDRLFDRQVFTECSGARLVDLYFAAGERIGECGDMIFGDNSQALAQVFADLGETTWRGGRAYLAPMHAGNLRVELVDRGGATTVMPIFGHHELIVTDDLRAVLPMKPNMRHQFAWLGAWVAEHGARATIRWDYAGVAGSIEVMFEPEGLATSAGRL